jgi:hypothetical protein
MELLGLYLTDSPVSPLTKEFVETANPLWYYPILKGIYLRSHLIFCVAHTYIVALNSVLLSRRLTSISDPSQPTNWASCMVK